MMLLLLLLLLLFCLFPFSFLVLVVLVGYTLFAVSWKLCYVIMKHKSLQTALYTLYESTADVAVCCWLFVVVCHWLFGVGGSC